MTTKPKAVVLLSGGQDSTTTLYWALKKGFDVYALNLHYGQRHVSEIVAADKVAARAGVPLESMDLEILSVLSDSALVDSSRDIQASGGYLDQAMPEGLPTSFVPGRNAFFLLTAAAYAVKIGAKVLVTGVCQTDYSGYPDCRLRFIDAMRHMLDEAMPSSCGPFTIYTPLMDMTKAETVQLMRSFGAEAWAALGDTVTCYEGQIPGCGECPACKLRAAGFEEAGEVDPAQ